MAELSEEKKLVWLGFKNPQQDTSQIQTEIEKLKSEVGDFETYQSDLDSVSSYSEHATYLQNNGFSESEATAFNKKIQNNFDSWSAYKTAVQNEVSSYAELKARFNSGGGLSGDQETEEGGPAAGIEIHDSPSVSKDGVDLPSGTIEIYGARVEFSQTDSVVTGEASISYSGLAIDNQTPTQGEVITIEATVENTGSAGGESFPQLKVDGVVEKSAGPISLTSGETSTVSFTYSFDQIVRVNVTIGDLAPKEVLVEPGGLEGVGA